MLVAVRATNLRPADLPTGSRRRALDVIAFRGVKATMLLADYAVVSDGKLTIVGGGWSQTGPEPASFGIGLLIQVPWDQANTPHAFAVELVDSDGAEVVLETAEEDEQPVAFGGEFEVGRPPGLKPGTPLDFPVAVNSTPLPLEPGRYEWRLTMNWKW